VILADEPTAALDRHRGRAVMELLARHARERNAAVLVCTYDERALDLADRVLRIEDGRLSRG
jgi:putative ABC transport system ATP-binding protein